MYGMLKISIAVFANTYQDRVNARHISLYTRKCSAEEARMLAKEWIDMNKEGFNVNFLDIVFSPDVVQIDIDELK